MKTTINDLYADIWLQIFEYFNATELLTSIAHVTEAIDQLLFNKNHYVHLRQLILDVHMKSIPQKLPFDQVISLELHEENRIDVIDQCLKLRSLKLVGQSEWAIHILEKVSSTKINLRQLILVLPGIHSLPEIFALIPSTLSISRLEIYANQLEQTMKIASCFPTQTNVRQFLLDTCSSIGISELAYMLSVFPSIYFLNITLFTDNKPFPSLPILPNLRCICLQLFEVRFEWIVHLIRVTPILTKLKLIGLIDSEGFIINHRWIHLFQSCSSLVIIKVNASLQIDTHFFFSETNRTLLREFNLELSPIHDDADIFSCESNQQNWLKLSGTIVRDYIRL